MAKINLLDWREAYRKERLQQFVGVMITVALVSGLAAYIWISIINASIDEQRARNQYLESEIAVLEKKVKEIKELKARREDLLARMAVIQGLQGKRPLIVRYFDELVRAVPEGVYLVSLSRQGDVVTVEGVTESNVRVSAFMRNLDGAEWFKSPNLSTVKAEPKFGEQASTFKLTFITTAPVDDDAREG
jgi:type IV pilus assembly protein PilN